MSPGKEIGQRVKAAVENKCGKNRGNLHQCAELTGISESSIGRYASGNVTPPYGALVKISRGCGVSLEWLATGEGAMISAGPSGPSGADVSPSVEEILQAIGAIQQSLATLQLRVLRGDVGDLSQLIGRIEFARSGLANAE